MNKARENKIGELRKNKIKGVKIWGNKIKAINKLYSYFRKKS